MQNSQVYLLLQWYQENKRDLVFRKTKDPYAIWVSEVMAQQTQINTMLSYYQRWMQKYPTIESLSKANMEDVLNLWHGLGYYNRAKNLVNGANYIQTTLNGQIPTNYHQWLNVSGVGPYIAAAITSICFDEKVLTIDGNVNRVFARYLALDLVQGTSAFRKEIESIGNQWLHYAPASMLNQALMELGALVCTKYNAKCGICPLNKYCCCKDNYVNYPKVKVKKANPIEIYDVIYIEKEGKVALMKPPYSDGLMQGYYRLPYQLTQINPSLQHIQHVYSHKTWIVQYNPKLKINKMDIEWMDKKKLINKHKLIVAHQKILKISGLLD